MNYKIKYKNRMCHIRRGFIWRDDKDSKSNVLNFFCLYQQWKGDLCVCRGFNMLFGNIYLHEKVFSRNPIIYLTSLSNYNIFRSWVISTPLKLLYVWKNLVQLIKKIHFTSEKEIWQNLKNEIGRHPRLFRISSTSSRLCSISNKKNEKHVNNKRVHQIDCFCCCFTFEELEFWKLRYRFSTPVFPPWWKRMAAGFWKQRACYASNLSNVIISLTITILSSIYLTLWIFGWLWPKWWRNMSFKCGEYRNYHHCLHCNSTSWI